MSAAAWQDDEGRMHDPEQFMPALAKANAMRFRRAEVRRRVVGAADRPASAAALAAALVSPLEPSLARFALVHALRWVRRGGPKFRREVLYAIEATEGRELGSLSARQLAALRITLERWPDL